MKPDRSQRCLAIGIKVEDPRIFWDRDIKEGEDRERVILDIRTYLDKSGISEKRLWSIYSSKHGFHIIVKCESWDETQEYLYEFKKNIGGQSIMSCRQQRIRISPKFLELGAKDISEAPVLLCSNTKEELRIGRKEIYSTYDIGLETGSEGFLR